MNYLKMYGISFLFIYGICIQPNIIIDLHHIKENSPYNNISNRVLSLEFLKKIKKACNIEDFIETGTFLGGTCKQASQIFNSVYTIELKSDIYEKALKNLKDHSNVSLFFGNSRDILPKVLSKAKQNCLLWLDAHYIFYEKYNIANNSEETSLIDELNIIKNSKHSNFILLIDDIIFCDPTLIPDRKYNLQPTLEVITNTILSISPLYNFVIIDDALLAFPSHYNLKLSPFISAYTMSRLYNGKNYKYQDILASEKIISQATDKHREFLEDKYNYILNNKIYFEKGIGKYHIFNKALLALNDKDYKKALELFLYVKNRGLNHWRINWYLAQAAYKLADFENTMILLNDVLKEEPTFLDAKLLLNSLKKINT